MVYPNPLRIGLLLIFLALASCENDPVEVKKMASDKEYPVSTARNIEIVYTDSARLKAVLNAPLRETYLGDNERVEFKQGVKVLFYSDDGKQSGNMTAGYGISYSKTEQMIARNNVEMYDALQGKRLNTEELIWDQKTGKIRSDKFSKITSKEEVIYGDGFESNQDFSNYRILKIRGIVNLSE